MKQTPARDGGNIEPIGYDLLGTGEANDEWSVGWSARRGRCYELAAWALAFGSAPADAKLVHGSIDGGSELGRFGHAWLRLVDGRIWEPTRAEFYCGPRWIRWADARVEAEYTCSETRAMIREHEHYGSWHDASVFRVVSEREQVEGKLPFRERPRWVFPATESRG